MNRLLPTCERALLVIVLANLIGTGGGCPHEGRDHRMLGRTGCWVQRKLTVENAQSPTQIWSFQVAEISFRIDPRHPHVLIEWPAKSRMLWRFRAGYRWDANAKAYIFPAIAFKKVRVPMIEYARQAKLAAQ